MIKSLLTRMDIEYLERRTKKTIEAFGIDNLMEYTVNSMAGCDISDFYKTIVEEVLIEEAYVDAWEISEGKYELSIEFEGKDTWRVSSHAWDTLEIIVENLMESVIIPHIRRGRASWQNQSIA